MTQQDQGNNEMISRGVAELNGRFTAHTGVTSKTFATRRGAENYLKKFGISPDGNVFNTDRHFASWALSAISPS